MVNLGTKKRMRIRKDMQAMLKIAGTRRRIGRERHARISDAGTREVFRMTTFTVVD